MKDNTYDKVYDSCKIQTRRVHHFISRIPIEKKAKAAIKFYSAHANMNEVEFLYNLIKEVTNELVHHWKMELVKETKKPVFLNNNKVKFITDAYIPKTKSKGDIRAGRIKNPS